jgi:hypothetical protein
MTPALYSVRLDDPTSKQYRIRTLEAESVQQARSIVEQMEATRAGYSLADLAPVRGVSTRRHEDGVHATVNMSLFADSGLGGGDLLAYVERDHAIDADGKAYGPSRHLKAHLQAHYQREAWKVKAIDPVVWSPQQLVTAALAMQQHEGVWEKALAEMREAGLPLAAVTASLFGVPWQKQIDGSSVTVYSSATVKNALTTSTYTPDPDTHDFFNDVTNEVTGTGYTAGGQTLASKTSTYDTATDQTRLDAADTSWTTSTITARRSVVWVDTAGASSTDPVWGWIDFGADVSTTAGTFLITYDATGIVVFDTT